MRYLKAVESLQEVLREARRTAGLSQRALAQRAHTSQPAVARYERGTATPSWETMHRLAAACGQRLRLVAEPAVDPHDVELAARLLELTPAQRLRSLSRYAHLHEIATERDD
jgi:transcriptional regulator with XRE-family HTH domain